MSSVALGQAKVKRFRTKFTEEQLTTLKDFYRHDNHPRRTELEELAGRLGLDYSVVKQWFDNKRHRDRPSSHTAGGSPGPVGRNGSHGFGRSSSDFARDPAAHPRGRPRGVKAPSSFGKGDDDYEGPLPKREYPFNNSDYLLPADSALNSVYPAAGGGGGGGGSSTSGSPSSVVLSGSTCPDASAVTGSGDTLISFSTPVAGNGVTSPKKPRRSDKRLSQSSSSQHFHRPNSEPMEFYEEDNIVLHPMPRNTSYDKKDFIETLLPQFFAMIEKRKAAHGEVDYSDFMVETQRLFDGLAYICECRVEQGASETNNTFKSGYISLPARRDPNLDAEAELAEWDKLVEISFLHEAREEGDVGTSGRQVATQRLVMCHFDETQSLTCEVGVKARGPPLSLDPICQCQSDVFPQHPQRIHELPDGNTTYLAWGDIDKLRSLVDTSMNPRELLTFLVFVISPLLHGAHWMNTCMRQFFPPGTPHYYDVVEGLT